MRPQRGRGSSFSLPWLHRLLHFYVCCNLLSWKTMDYIMLFKPLINNSKNMNWTVINVNCQVLNPRRFAVVQALRSRRRGKQNGTNFFIMASFKATHCNPPQQNQVTHLHAPTPSKTSQKTVKHRPIGFHMIMIHHLASESLSHCPLSDSLSVLQGTKSQAPGDDKMLGEKMVGNQQNHKSSRIELGQKNTRGVPPPTEWQDLLTQILPSFFLFFPGNFSWS